MKIACGIPSALAGGILAAACSAGEGAPSSGSYNIQFPSTAAAIATDGVQVLVYDVDARSRAKACDDLLAARKRRDSTRPVVVNASANTCELFYGKRPIEVPYGDKALLAIASRKGEDFLLGCVVGTFAEGSAPVSIRLDLVDASQPVPDSQCATVADFCQRRCTAS